MDGRMGSDGWMDEWVEGLMSEWMIGKVIPLASRRWNC